MLHVCCCKRYAGCEEANEKDGPTKCLQSYPEPNFPPIIRRAACRTSCVASLATETIMHFHITFQPLRVPECTRLIQCE